MVKHTQFTESSSYKITRIFYVNEKYKQTKFYKKLTKFDNLGGVVNMTLTPDISLVHGSGFGYQEISKFHAICNKFASVILWV